MSVRFSGDAADSDMIRAVYRGADPETVRDTEPFTVALSHLGEGFEVTVRHTVWVPPHGSTKLKCARRFRCAARHGVNHGALGLLTLPLLSAY